jgi:hypothetical protein
MYSVMSSATGGMAGIRLLVDLGNDWAWVALVAWAATAAGLVRSGLRTTVRSRSGRSGDRRAQKGSIAS